MNVAIPYLAKYVIENNLIYIAETYLSIWDESNYDANEDIVRTVQNYHEFLYQHARYLNIMVVDEEEAIKIRQRLTNMVAISVLQK